MSWVKLSRPDQPWPLRRLLQVYEFCASLKLAVVLIATLSAVLAWATFVESNLGAAGARYYVYQADWFLWLNALLALNIFCAASIRYPWKRHQTGFVVVHVGLLTLLGGSAYSYIHSVNAQLLVYKGESNSLAVDIDAIGYMVFDGLPGRKTPLRVPFRPGPYNWADEAPSRTFRQLFSLVGMDDLSKPWVPPARTLYATAEGNTKVELVDYYARSEVRLLPFIGLNFEMPALKMSLPIELEFDQRQQHAEADFPPGQPNPMGRILFWRTTDPGYATGIREFHMERSVDSEPAVVIYHNGESHFLSISKLTAERDAGTPVKLSDTLAVSLVTYAERPDVQALLNEDRLRPAASGRVLPAVELMLTNPSKPDERSRRIVRFADLPFARNQEMPPGTIIDLFHASMSGRVDIVEGPEQTLSYRVWQKGLGRISAHGNMTNRDPVDTWSMGGGERVWKMTLADYRPRAATDELVRVFPLPFEKDDRGLTRRVRIRISTDDKTASGGRRVDEFWLSQNAPPPWQAEGSQQVHTTRAGDQTIKSRYEVNQVDVGFSMRLDDFDLKMDPGSRTASNYTSYVTIADFRRDADVIAFRKQLDAAQSSADFEASATKLGGRLNELLDKALREVKPLEVIKTASVVDNQSGYGAQLGLADKVFMDGMVSQHVVTMNAPLEYPDPRNRALRFFQENYVPPGSSPGKDLASIFRVNYDPGRWIKYLGSLLICVGIYLMFYMKAYFFKRPAKATKVAAANSGS